MRLEAAFRLSLHLTLALACACLGYAEYPFLPWMIVFGPVVAGGLLVSFLLGSRRSVSLRTANTLGFGLAVGAALWIAYHALHPPDDSDQSLVLPAALLPYFGPVLMVLLLAKLLRAKQIHDFWLLHIIGLLEVILACILTGQPFFGVLLILYLLCWLWSLALFHLYRGERTARGRRRVPAPEPMAARAATVPWRLLGIPHSGRWALLVIPLSLALFLLTPQHGKIQWNSFARSGHGDFTLIESGFSEEVDLNRTGNVEIDNRVALHIYAEDARGRPKLDLSPQQRWRGLALDYYKHGSWQQYPFKNAPGLAPVFLDSRKRQRPLPDLGPRQYFLTFEAKAREMYGLFLADPVVTGPGHSLPPVMTLKLPERFAGAPEVMEAISLQVIYRQEDTCQYKQVTRPPAEPELSQPVALTSREMTRLLRQPVPGIRSWTVQLVQRLVAEGKLAGTDLRGHRSDGPPGTVSAERWEEVARALSDYLALSGEYTYTLNLRRHDRGLDPAEDFLRHVKQGHCERFATALVLMLRSCGIPARLVVGFRGADSEGDGHYVVRHSHAHSWVEAVIQRPGPRGQPEWHWLALDPTPSKEGPATRMFSWDWWRDAARLGQTLWNTFVLEYDTDQQQETATTLWEHLALARRGQALLSGLRQDLRTGRFWTHEALYLAAAAAGLLLLRRVRYRWRRRVLAGPASLAGFYGRLLAVLARRTGQAPLPSQTPQEFAAVAAATLQRRTGDPVLARLPGWVIDLFYRVRYGRRPLSLAEQREVERRISELDVAL